MCVYMLLLRIVGYASVAVAQWVRAPVPIALNGYTNSCIIWQEFSNWSPMYRLG